MAYHEVPAPFGDGGTKAIETLYPELRVRTLGEFLRAKLEGKSEIIVEGFDEIKFEGVGLSPFWATARGVKRKSQLSLAARERLIMADLWESGVGIGRAASNSFDEIAQFLREALIGQFSLRELEKRVPIFAVSEEGRLMEQGASALVDDAWAKYAKWFQSEPPTSIMVPLFPLLEAAAQIPELRQLMIFSSMNRLCFSRIVGSDGPLDCPYAYHNKEKGWYEVHRAEELYADREDEPIGAGNATEVAQMLADALPPNCGPAVLGTADDLI